MSDAKKIAVLGAGPMGLAVAYQLTKMGYNPHVFEADDRVGGMTACFDFEGTKIERYYHFHCTSDSAFFEILEELDIQHKLHWRETRMGYWYKGMVQDWGNPVALLKFKGLGLIAKVRYGLHAFLSTKRNNWEPLDRENAIRWLKRWVGEEAYEILWHRLFKYKFYDLSENLSAAWIWSRIRRVGRSRYNLFKEKLGALEGGSDTLLKAMQSEIENTGGQIRLSSPVQQVIAEENKVTGVIVDERFIPYDRVISTIPLPFVPRLIPAFSEPTLKKYQALKNVAVVCVIVKLRRAVTRNFWLNTNDPEMDIPGLVEYTNLRELDEHIVYVPFYMPGDHPKFEESNEAFIAKVKSYLRKINPDLENDDFIAARASRYRYAQPVCGPNFLEQLPPVKSEIEGLWVADTSYYYPEDRGISESIDFGRNLARMVVS